MRLGKNGGTQSMCVEKTISGSAGPTVAIRLTRSSTTGWDVTR